MTKFRNNKKVLKYLESTLEDSKFILQHLLDEHFINFQFEDNYGFGNHPNRGLIRKRIVQLLFEIHDKWKIELEKLNKPYYLAIWLCEPHIMRSEVVCAIDERIELYSDHWFDISEKGSLIRKEAYGQSQHQFDRFNWERKKLYNTHENADYNGLKEQYDKIENYYNDRRYYQRVLPKCKKIEDSKYGKVYYQEVGDVWIGIEK